jgi:hypothetical protein
VRLAARVGLDRRGGLFPKLLHDQEPIGLVYRALDVQNLMAAKKGEMRPFGSHGLVFLDRERETVSVHDSSPHSHRKPTTSSARSGFTSRTRSLASLKRASLRASESQSRIPRLIPRPLGSPSASVPLTTGGQALVLEVSRNAEALAEQMLSDACELVLSGWCQGTGAEDEMGRAIESSSAFARRWSVAGALERVWRRALDGDDVALEAFERANLALAAAVKDAPQRWNDAPERTRAQALDALLEAPRFLLAAARGPDGLVDDLLDDLDRYQEIPSHIFESSP